MRFFGKTSRVVARTLLLLLGSGILLLGANQAFLIFLAHKGPQILSDAVLSQWGKSLDINSVEWKFPGTVVAKGVTFKTGDQFSIEEVSLTYFPWNLSPSKIWNGVLVDIEARQPSVDVSQLSFPPQPANPKKRQITMPFPVRVNVFKGKILGLPEGDARLEAGLLFDQKGLYVTGKGSHPAVSKANFILETSPKGNWSFSSTIKKLNLPEIFPEKFKWSHGSLRLVSDIHVEAEGENFKFEWKNDPWKATFQNIQTHFKAKEGPFEISSTGSGSLRFSEANLKLSSENQILFLGKINHPFEKPLFDFQVKGDQIPLSHLAFLPKNDSSYPLDGPLTFNASVKGSQEDFRLEANLKTDLHQGKIKIPPMKGTLDYSKGRFNFSGKGPSSHYQISGKRKQDGGVEYQAQLNSVKMENLGRLNNWPNIKGTIQAGLTGIYRPRGISSFQGNFSLEEPRWGRKKGPEKATGTFAFDGKNLSVETDNNLITATARKEGDKIVIDHFSVYFDTYSHVSAQGNLNSQTGYSQFSFQGNQIPPDVWPPLVRQYPEIKGSLDFDGKANRSPKKNEGSLHLILHDISFVNDGEKWNGEGDLNWNADGFRFKILRVDGGYRGEFSFLKTSGQPFWGVDLTFDSADPQLLFEVIKQTEPAGGKISGHFLLNQQNGRWTGKSSVNWDSPSFKKLRADLISFETEQNGPEITINELTVLKNEMAIRTSGSVMKEGNRFRVDARAQNQQVGNRFFKMDGEAEIKGWINPKQGDFNSRIQSEIFWVNEYPFRGLDFNLSKRGQKIFLEGSDQGELKANVKANLESKNLNGKIATGALDISALTKSFSKFFQIPDEPIGQASIDLDLRGFIDRPLVQSKIEFSSVTWRDENFSGQGFLRVEGSTVTVVSSRAEFAGRGNVFAKGKFVAEKNGLIQIEGVGTRIALDTIFRFLKWPIRWEGETNMSFELAGPAKDKKINLVFDGYHEGFGPFPDGGPLTGTAFFQDRKWDLSGITVNSGEGFLRLKSGSSVFVQKGHKGNMRVVADARNMRLGAVVFFGGLELTGSWEGGDKNIQTEKEGMEFNLFARSLWINQYVLNGNVTRLKTGKDKITFFPIPGSQQQVSGVLDYSHFPGFRMESFSFIEDGVEKLFVDGEVGSPTWDFKFRSKEIDAAIVRGLLDLQIPMEGNMDIRANVAGQPSNPKIDSVVTWRNGKLFNIPLDFGNAKIEMENGIVDVTKIFTRKKDGYVLKGTVKFGVGLSEESEDFPPEIRLRLENGKGRILEEIFPSVSHAKGNFSGELTLVGTGADRFISGDLFADDLRFRSSSYIPSLKRGRIKIRFDQDRLVVEEARARLKNGNLQLEGGVEFEEGIPEEFDLRLYTTTERGVSIRIPELAIPPGPFLDKFSLLKKKLSGVSRGEPKFNLFLKGSYEEPRVEGKVELENVVFTFPPPPKKGSEGAPPRWFSEFIDRVNWDVVLLAGKRTRYENELVNARLEGSIHLGGQTENLAVNGRIISEQGAIVYSGNEFKINEAILEVFSEKEIFKNSEELETYVYLKAEAEKEVFYTNPIGDSVKDTIVMEVDRALLGQIQPRFRSKNNPNLSSEKAFRLALGLPLSSGVEEGDLVGSTNQNTSADENNRLMRAGLVQLLDSSLASPLARAIARQTGLIDFIRVTYQEEDSIQEGAPPNPDQELEGQNVDDSGTLRYVKGTKVKMGRELAGRLFADYSFRFDEYENQVDLRHELELAYRVHKNLFIRAISELDSERTLGRPPDRRALLENRWRFGLPRKKKKGPVREETPDPVQRGTESSDNPAMKPDEN